MCNFACHTLYNGKIIVMSIRVEFKYPSPFAKLANIFAEYVEMCNLEFTSMGMRAYTIDDARVCMLQLQLHPDAFRTFET